MHNLSGLASQLSKKALDAGSALADAQRRVTQQAMEATGMAEKTEEDEPAELQMHNKLEAFMRRSYKHADQYMRALNSMCEMSAALADDFAELIDDPVIRELAAQNSAANHRETMKAMTALGQLLHRKVFKPVQREVEGRKDLEKRLADRKKVRLDYDAYRRKQQNLLQSDAANSGQYEANLEAARRTFTKHQQGVLRDVGMVNGERQQMVSEAFLGLLAAQQEFLTASADALSQVGDAAERAGRDDAKLRGRWEATQAEVVALRNSVAAPRGSAGGYGSAAAAVPREFSPAGLSVGDAPAPPAAAPAASSYAPPVVPAQQPRPGQHRQSMPPAPPPARPAVAKAHTTPNLLGDDADFAHAFSNGASRGAYAPPQPPQSAHHPSEVDLLGGAFGGAPAAAPAAAPPAANGMSANGSATDLLGMGDLLGGGSGHASSPTSGQATPPGGDLMGGGMSMSASPSGTDLMGGAGGMDSGMDDLFSMAAAPALVPSAAPTTSQRSSPTHPSWGGGGGGGGGGDLMGGGGGDLMGGGGLDDLMMGSPVRGSGSGGMMGGQPSGRGSMGGQPSGRGSAISSAAASVAASVARPSQEVDPFAPEKRKQLQAARLAKEQAAIAARVQQVQDAQAGLEQDRETERVLEKTLKVKVAQWQKDKKNLRALLASLHEIAPPCSWKPVSMAELIDPKKVKKSYHRACLAVHPDKQDAGDLESKVMAQLLFDALRESWHVFEKTG